jgi:hypothetical protein
MTGILNAIFATFGGPGETTVEYLVVAGGGGRLVLVAMVVAVVREVIAQTLHLLLQHLALKHQAVAVSIESAFTATFGTAYTVTVGAGGAGSTRPGTLGSNSVFSTITSLGGGGGGVLDNSVEHTGGSGGGGWGTGAPAAVAWNC